MSLHILGCFGMRGAHMNI